MIQWLVETNTLKYGLIGCRITLTHVAALVVGGSSLTNPLTGVGDVSGRTEVVLVPRYIAEVSEKLLMSGIYLPGEL